MNEYQEQKKERIQTHVEKLTQVAKHLGDQWRIDIRKTQGDEPWEIVYFKNGFFSIHVNFNTYQKNVKASLFNDEWTRAHRSINFSISRPAQTLANDIKRRLIFDFDEINEKFCAKREKDLSIKSEFNTRVNAFKSFFGFNKLEYMAGTFTSNVYTPDVLHCNFQWREKNQVMLGISKESSRVNIMLCDVSENVAYQVLGLIKSDEAKENEKENSHV